MSLVRNKPTNQSKWIRGIAPPVKGNYLVHFLRTSESISSVYTDIHEGMYYQRVDFDPILNKWIYKDGSEWHEGIKIPVSADLSYDIIWWDEYNYFGEIRKLKIKFPHEREIPYNTK